MILSDALILPIS